MVRVLAGFFASGPQFSPGVVERRTGVRFSRKNECGEMGMTGRYRGQPIPYGSGDFQGPEAGLDPQVPDEHFFESVEALARECSAAGATSMRLHLDVEYVDQCNLEWSSAFVSALGRARVAVTISCYERG